YLYENPKRPYTQALLSAVPEANPHPERQRIILTGDLPSPANPPTGCKCHTRCPYAEEICRTQEPAFKQVAPAGQMAACHFVKEVIEENKCKIVTTLKSTLRGTIC